MTEREMLEAAARAMGMRVICEGAWPQDCCGWFFKEVDGAAYLWSLEAPRGPWSPRYNSAQALDMAAALRISVEHNHPEQEHNPWVLATIEGPDGVDQVIEHVPDESQRADRMRLAILRCAAAQAPKEQA